MSSTRQANQHHVKPVGESAGQSLNRVFERYRYQRIHGELLKPGHRVSPSTIRRVLKALKIPPAPTEVTDPMLIFGERHLRTILAQYEAHYNGRRPDRSRQLRPPRPGHLVADLSRERIQRRAVLGGLINEYEQAA